MKENKYLKFIPIILVASILLFTVLFFLLPKKSFSENENRVLETIPKLSLKTIQDGSFMNQITNYVSDHFPFRDFWITLKTKIDQLEGKKSNESVYFGKKGYLLEKYKQPENTEKIIKTLNQFYQKNNHLNVSLMLVPTSIQIYQEYLPRYAPHYSQLDTINDIYQQLHFNSIPLYDTFMEQKQNYQLFYRLDHHWTTFGAYFAYQKYCALNDISAIPLNDFQIDLMTDRFKGTLYSKTLDWNLKPDSIYRFTYQDHHYEVNYVFSNRITNTMYESDYLEKKDKYSYFLDNNHPLITITNQDLTNDSEILVIKDSYANSFVPFLTNHYRKVHVIDPRFYKQSISDYLKEHQQIQDVLFLYNMNTIDQDLGILTVR